MESGRPFALREFDFTGRACWRCKTPLADFENASVTLTSSVSGENEFGLTIHPDAIGIVEGPRGLTKVVGPPVTLGGNEIFGPLKAKDFSFHKYKMLCVQCISTLFDGVKSEAEEKANLATWAADVENRFKVLLLANLFIVISMEIVVLSCR